MNDIFKDRCSPFSPVASNTLLFSILLIRKEGYDTMSIDRRKDDPEAAKCPEEVCDSSKCNYIPERQSFIYLILD